MGQSVKSIKKTFYSRNNYMNGRKIIELILFPLGRIRKKRSYYNFVTDHDPSFLTRFNSTRRF